MYMASYPVRQGKDFLWKKLETSEETAQEAVSREEQKANAPAAMFCTLRRIRFHALLHFSTLLKLFLPAKSA